MIRPKVVLTRRQSDMMVDSLMSSANRQATYDARRYAEMMVEEVERLVAERTQRREGDRHKRGTTHLDTSFKATVQRGAKNGWPIRIELTTKPGVSAAKVAALEYGITETYYIEPREGEWLTWDDEGGRGRARRVKVEPREGLHFMRDAHRAVLARIRAGG